MLDPMAHKREEDQEPKLYDLREVQVLGLSELSKRWGVSKQRASEIAEQRCPHWRKVGCGRIWLLHEVEEFEKTWSRQPSIHITPRKRRADSID
jgi:hypothetical protein